MPVCGGGFGPRARSCVWSCLGTVLLSSLLAGACSHTPAAPATCEQPPPFVLHLDASTRLNADDVGRSLPTNIQVFQLKGSRRLEAADFQDLWQRPKEVLEEDLLAMDEFTLEPGQQLTREVSRTSGASYLAVVGVFRRPAGQVWRAVERLPQVKPEDCDPAKKAGGRGSSMRFLVEDYRVEARSSEVRR